MKDGNEATGLMRLVVSIWHAGCEGKSAAAHRRIRLINQMAMLAFVATIPYQIFFLLYDVTVVYPVLALNFLFMGTYVAVFLLNHRRRYRQATFIAISCTLSHIFLVTFVVGAATGSHLFYIPVAGLMLLQEPRNSLLWSLWWLTFPVVLCLICHFFFLPDLAWVTLPGNVLHGMFGMSTGLTLLGTGMTALMFRIDIEDAELEQDAVRDELQRLSGIDQLTQLANRRRLDQHLSDEWARMQRKGQPLSVLMIDIDLFKRYNDLYGHPQGDSCLRTIAAALRSVALRPGDLVARYGGEEFLIVLPDTGEEGARALAEQARQAVLLSAIPHEHSDVAGVVTVSIGVASRIPDADGCQELLLKCADEALYAAKRAGRNRVISAVRSRATAPVAHA